MTASKHAAEFVALVTDGSGIDGYGRRCGECGQPTEVDDGRKSKFLKLGRAVMKELAALLGMNAKEVCVNPAGPAVSGDAYVYSRPGFRISFCHRHPRPEYGDFCANYGDGRNQWFRWEDLLDLPAVSVRIAALKSAAGERPAEEAVDPFS